MLIDKKKEERIMIRKTNAWYLSLKQEGYNQ